MAFFSFGDDSGFSGLNQSPLSIGFVSQANRISLVLVLPREVHWQRLLSQGSQKFGISHQTCLSLILSESNHDAKSR